MADRETHIRTCPLCEAMCGLEVHHEAGEVKLIRPNRNDVWSKGYICPKGTTLGHLHHDPDRLRKPLVRQGDRLVEASWDEALGRCQELISGVIERHGKSALTAYVGNPTAHNFSLSRYTGLFIALADFDMIYSAGTVDQWPKNVSVGLMFGNTWRIPAPDLPRTDLFIAMGANPHASQGSLLACADVLGEMDRVRERGGRCIVVDPRRTGTCDHADEWIPIVPGTDAVFLMAVLNVIVNDGFVDLGELTDVVAGLEDVTALVAGWTPESVAETCGIDAERIRAFAHEFAGVERAVLYGRIGLCNQEFGTLASWLIDVLNIVTAHFDVEGGMMFGNPVAWSITLLGSDDVTEQFGRWSSRVRGAPEVLGQVPVSCLAEEIATPGDGQIKGLITSAGNPVVSAPGAQHLDAALPLLECMISVDNWCNETTRHADVILPGLSPLEQPHYDELLWAWAVRSAAKYSQPLFPPPADRPREWEILTRLGAMIAGMDGASMDIAPIDDGYFGGLAETQGIEAQVALAASPEPGPERICDLQIRTGPWGDRYGENPDGLTLERVAAEPDGIDMGPMIPLLRDVLCTPSGKVELAPAYITADLPRLQERLERSRDSLLLTSRRDVRSNNSWMHNVKVLVKGKDRCTLLIHPDDADTAGVRDGDTARVSSEAGSVDVPVEVTDEMMPGVVSLPHGWGHDLDGVRLSVAAERASVNNNHLAPSTFVDEISGNAAVNGIPVEVAAV